MGKQRAVDKKIANCNLLLGGSDATDVTYRMVRDSVGLLPLSSKAVAYVNATQTRRVVEMPNGI